MEHREFIARIEFLIESYNPKKPLICVDERTFQLLEDVIQPIPMKNGVPEK